MPTGATHPSLPSLEELAANNPAWLDEAISPAEAAALIGVRPNTLAVWRVYGRGPDYVKFGRSVRYTRRVLFEFIRAAVKAPAA